MAISVSVCSYIFIAEKLIDIKGQLDDCGV